MFKSIYNQNQTIDDLVSTAWKILTGNLGSFLGLLALTIVISIGIVLLGAAVITPVYLANQGMSAALWFAATAFSILFIAILGVLSLTQMYLIKNIVDGKKPSLGDSLSKGFSKIVYILGTQVTQLFLFAILILVNVAILYLILAALIRDVEITTQSTAQLFSFFLPMLLFLLIFAAILITILNYLTFTLYEVAFSDRWSIGAITGSFSLVRGNWWRVFFYTFLFLGLPSGLTRVIGTGAVSIAVASLFSWFGGIVITLLYLNLKAKLSNEIETA